MPRPPVPFASLLALVASAPAWATPEDCPYGVNAHQAADEALVLAADAGLGWVRFDFNWTELEPAEGTYNWSSTDRLITTAESLGLHVFATVAYTPDWAAPAGCDNGAADDDSHCLNKVPDPARWVAFVTAAVDRYGSTVRHWGMWNEPNLGVFFSGSRDEYVDSVLIPGSNAVHAACPSCLVVGPELANLRETDWDADEGVCAFNECIFNGWEYSLAAVLDAAGAYIDIISHHRYDETGDSVWIGALDGQWWGDIQYMHGLKEVVDEHGQGQPVWITEFGWETAPGGDWSEAEAADELQATWEGFAEVRAGTFALSENDPWPELERMFWYDLNDDPNVYEDGMSTWGVLDGDLAPKSAYASYRSVIAAQGGCVEEEEDEDDEEDTDGGEDEGDDDEPVDDEETGTGAGVEDSDTANEEPGAGSEALPGTVGGTRCGCGSPVAASGEGVVLAALCAAIAVVRAGRRKRRDRASLGG